MPQACALVAAPVVVAHAPMEAPCRAVARAFGLGSDMHATVAVLSPCPHAERCAGRTIVRRGARWWDVSQERQALQL